MTPRSTHGQRNRLVRRVMRHRSIAAIRFGEGHPSPKRMATLFREPEAPAGASMRFGQGQVVSEGWDARDPLPAVQFQGEALPGVTELQDPGENRQPVPEQAAPAGPPATAAPAPTGRVPGSGGEITPQAEVVPRDEGALDEKVWQRLTSIFRRHQEKAGGEEAGERGERGSAELSHPPETQPLPRAERGAAQASPLPQPDEVDDPHVEAAAPPERAMLGAETTARPRQPVARRSTLVEERPPATEAHTPAPRDPSDPTPLTAGAESGPGPEEAASGGEGTVQREPAPETVLDTRVPRANRAAAPVGRDEQRPAVPDPDLAVAGSGDVGHPGDGLRPEDAPRPTVARSRDEETASGPPAQAEPRESLTDAPSPTLPPPLEAVWQVERRTEVPPPAAGTLPPGSQGTAKTQSRLNAGSRAAHHQPAAHIEAGDRRSMPPTRSSIEVLPPRGPRPQVTRRGRLETAPPSQAPAPQTAAPQTAAPRTAAPQTAGPRTAGEVETEIGPLPADLWGLIGETAPAPFPPAFQEEAPDVAPGTPRRASPGLTPAATSPKASAPPPTAAAQPLDASPGRAPSPPPARKLKQEPAPERAPEPRAVTARPATIQRVMRVDELETEVEPDTANAPAETGEPEARAAAGGNLDLEDLARRVYADVKRRLSVERERARGR